MLFPGIDLAARIERAECEGLTAGAAAMARRRGDTGGFTIRLAGGVALYTVAGSPMNKVVGLGFAGPIDERELDAVERAYAERATAVQVELANLGEPAIAALLTRRGYVLQGFENVLGRRLPVADPGPRPGIDIAVLDSGNVPTWIDIMVDGFAAPDTQGVPSQEAYPRATISEILRDLTSSDVFTPYLAWLDGVPAGGASLRMGAGVAHLCGAATLPAHRRRGVQGALLAARLVAAGHAGCDLAVVTTQPGSKSQENAQRSGFELLYTRAILVRGAG